MRKKYKNTGVNDIIQVFLLFKAVSCFDCNKQIMVKLFLE